MVLLTALWGFQQVTIKVIAADVSPVMQAAIGSMHMVGRDQCRAALRRRIHLHLRRPGAYQRFPHGGVHLHHAAADGAWAAFLRARRAA
jgi:hypothetical protein